MPQQPNEGDLNQLADIRELVQRNEKIQAIKLYRERLGVGLREAKDAIDAMADDTFVPGNTAMPTPSPSAAESNQIDRDILRGEKIAAIKHYREQHHVGLKEAKEAIDAREAILRATAPKPIQPPPRKTTSPLQTVSKQGSGWGIVILMVFLLLALIGAYVYMQGG